MWNECGMNVEWMWNEYIFVVNAWMVTRNHYRNQFIFYNEYGMNMEWMVMNGNEWREWNVRCTITAIITAIDLFGDNCAIVVFK